MGATPLFPPPRRHLRLGGSGREEEPVEQGRWSLIVARDLALVPLLLLLLLHRLIFSFRLPLSPAPSSTRAPLLRPPRLLLSILKDRGARSRGCSWYSRAADGLCTWARSPLLSSPPPLLVQFPPCKGIFRCFSKFLQTGLMADDCVPKVHPRWKWAIRVSRGERGLLKMPRSRTVYNCRSALVFVLPPHPFHLLSPFFRTSGSRARVCGSRRACNFVAL